MSDTSEVKGRIFGILILLGIFLFFSVFPVVILYSIKTKLVSRIFTPTVISTPCYSLNVIPSLKPTSKNDPNNCNIDMTGTKIYFRITHKSYKKSYLEKDIITISKLDKDQFLESYPDAEILSEKELKSENFSGYGFIANFAQKSKNNYVKLGSFWIFNHGIITKTTDDNIEAFNIVIVAPPILYDRIINMVTKTWIWNTASAKKDNTNVLKQNSIKTPCYQAELKLETDKTIKISDCELSIRVKNDKDTVGVIAIDQFINSDATLEQEVVEWKKFNQSVQFISEKDIQIGNLPAHQIIFKQSPSNDTEMIEIFVYTGGRYNKNFQYPVNGFVISSSYDETLGTKENIDYMLSNWKWL